MFVKSGLSFICGLSDGDFLLVWKEYSSLFLKYGYRIVDLNVWENNILWVLVCCFGFDKIGYVVVVVDIMCVEVCFGFFIRKMGGDG